MKKAKCCIALPSINRYLIVLSFYSLIPKLLHSQSGFPAIISFNHEIGFMMDSTEINKNDLFPFIPRENLSYLVIIQKDSVAYEVSVVYKNGDNNLTRYNKETIMKEWQKVPVIQMDTAQISDYSISKRYFPEVASFIVLDSSFKGNVYMYGKNNTAKSALFFVELCADYVHMLSDADLPAFNFNTSVVFKNAIITGYWGFGQTRNLELVHTFLYSGPSIQYKYRELGLTGGWVIENRFVVFSISTGVSQVKYQIITSESNSNTILFPNYVRVSQKEQYEIGIPVCLDLSLPSFSIAGVSLKARTTFIYENKPVYNIGVGIRLGRASIK